MIEGCDFSRTPREGSPSVAALNAAGLEFVGRYAVNDKSPNGRGIDATEYQRYVDGGIEVFVYWESSEGWMLNGFEAGVSAAQNAQRNIEEAGMPDSMPVYFACDFDAAENQQDAIDGTLRGCASVVGADRVGLYAGYWPLRRAWQNKTARWFCQTLAWSGGLLLEDVHIYQYDTNGNFIDGTDVDLCRAYQGNYGQASKFDGIDIIVTEPFPPVKVPDWWPRVVGQQWPADARDGDLLYRVCRRNEVARANVNRYVEPITATVPKPAHSGPKVLKGETIHLERSVQIGKRLWFLEPDGHWLSSSAFDPIVKVVSRKAA